MVQEQDLAYLFAGLLAASSVLLLFLPVLHHVWLFATDRILSAAILVGLVALIIGAIALVVLAVSNPLYFAPIAGVTAALRIGSPPLLYWKVRDRFEALRAWAGLQLVVLAIFVGLAVFLSVHLAIGPSNGTAIGAIALSEQFIMVVGAAFLLTRFALRVRPQERAVLWPVWLSALLFAIAFIAVAPYAFPGFAIVYGASGIVGWTLAAILLWRDR